MVTVIAFAATVFGSYDKKTVKRVRRLLAAGVLPHTKLGAKPKVGHRDLRRIFIPLHSGRAALMASGGTP